MVLATAEAAPKDWQTRTLANPPTDDVSRASRDVTERKMPLARTAEVEALGRAIGDAGAGGRAALVMRAVSCGTQYVWDRESRYRTVAFPVRVIDEVTSEMPLGARVAIGVRP